MTTNGNTNMTTNTTTGYVAPCAGCTQRNVPVLLAGPRKGLCVGCAKAEEANEAKQARDDAHRQIDGNIVKFWPLKRDAIAAAKSIGWMAKDVGQVWTRFQIGYAIHDNDGTWMTKERFSFIANIR